MRVSQRARRAKIVVDGRRNVEIVVPPRTSAAAVDRMLVEHAEWLARELAKPPRPFRLGLQRDDCVWLGAAAGPLPDVPRLDRWYRERARAATASVVEREAGRLGVDYGAISIREQRTRWGSCSPIGSLSFNWRLVLAPEPILEYVVVHELCHRLRHDHSAVFWRLVAGVRPGYLDEKRWLDEHGPELLAYRVPERCPSAGRPLTATAR